MLRAVAPIQDGLTVGVKTSRADGEMADVLSRETVDTCVRHFGDRVRSIVLTGSLARNEGSFRKTSTGWELLGDAEYFVVLDDIKGVDREREMRTLKQQIQDSSAHRGLKCSVSLGIADDGFFRKQKPHIFAYELRNCGKSVFGDSDILGLIPRFAAADIPLEDGWRLLANRLVEQLEVLASTDETSDRLPDALLYRTVKLYLDMATSLLLFLGKYEPSYRARCEGLRALTLEPSSDEFPFDLERFAHQVACSTAWKLSPGTESEPDSRWPFWLASQRYAVKLWNWELARLMGTNTSAGLLLLPADLKQPISSRLRGWANVVREAGWQETKKYWPRWAVAAVGSSPRYRVYSAAAELYSMLPAILVGKSSETEPRIREIHRWLPVADCEPGCGWRALGRAIAWNYRLFLENTRS